MPIDAQGRWYSNDPCWRWPDCDCHRTLIHWQDTLPTVPNEDVQFTWEDLQIIAFLIGVSLACISVRCPNRKMKTYARGQLNTNQR
jgi:hypothetical protein